MDVFEFIKLDEASLSHRFDDAVQNYSVWPFERVFAESKRLIDGVNNLFETEKLLTSNLKEENGLEDVLMQVNNQQNEILNETENLVMIHVDEPGFESGLEKIACRLKEHIQFCDETFYPKVEARLSDEDRRRVNDQLERHVLG